MVESGVEHGIKLMDEVGRLLGAWLKASKNAAARLRALDSP